MVDSLDFEDLILTTKVKGHMSHSKYHQNSRQICSLRIKAVKHPSRTKLRTIARAISKNRRLIIIIPCIEQLMLSSYKSLRDEIPERPGITSNKQVTSSNSKQTAIIPRGDSDSYISRQPRPTKRSPTPAPESKWNTKLRSSRTSLWTVFKR